MGPTMMSTQNKTKKNRKPGSGRKRKIGAITSQDYAEQLQQLEQREALCFDMTPQEREALRKKKRSLKNRMSALKSRENKRTKLERLEKAVQSLQEQINALTRENQALRQSRSSSSTENSCDPPKRKRSRSVSPTQAKENGNSQQELCSPTSVQSLYSSCSKAQKVSTPVKPCTHNCRSAVGDAMEDFAFDIFD